MTSWLIDYTQDKIPQDGIVYGVILLAGGAFWSLISFPKIIPSNIGMGLILIGMGSLTLHQAIKRRSRLAQHAGSTVLLTDSTITIGSHQLDLDHVTFIHPRNATNASRPRLLPIPSIGIIGGYQNLTNFLTKDVIARWGIVVSAPEIDLCYLPPGAFDTKDGPLSTKDMVRHIEATYPPTNQLASQQRAIYLIVLIALIIGSLYVYQLLSGIDLACFREQGLLGNCIHPI